MVEDNRATIMEVSVKPPTLPFSKIIDSVFTVSRHKNSTYIPVRNLLGNFLVKVERLS